MDVGIASMFAHRKSLDERTRIHCSSYRPRPDRGRVESTFLHGPSCGLVGAMVKAVCFASFPRPSSAAAPRRAAPRVVAALVVGAWRKLKI